MRLISISEHLLALSSTGLLGMGIMNWIGDENDKSAGNENVSADGGDDLFGDLEDGDDGEFGGMDDGFDDDFDDDFGEMGGGDDFGGMGGDMGGGGGDMGGGGGGQIHQEMENRVDGLENEVAEISSTINTVRSENEEISETVDEIEENVRKLLEIYEMVTRGVNPFVDDVQESGGMGGGSAFGGDFGLFDDDSEDESEEDVDDDVMDADAESFFDDDALDDFEDDDEVDELDEGTLDGDLGEASLEDDQDGEGSGASSFQELKAEYESGEAEWADEEGDGEDSGGGDDIEATIDADTTESGEEFEIEAELDENPIEETSEETANAGEEEFEFVEAVEEPEPANRSSGRSDEKPYLDTLPGGYVVDLVVMEWLEFLVGEFGPEEAVRTIEYYEQIEWVSKPASDQLLAFLEGLADIEPDGSDGLGPVELEIDDHIQSLTFISQLTGDSIDQKIVDHCAQIRGEGRGIQR